MFLFWVTIFVVSLSVLIKSADWFLESAEKIGKVLGLPSFAVGVFVVGFGTSLPELASSIAAVFAGAPEIVVANIIGSNIANILLIVGISALVARELMIAKSLIDLDIPLLALSTVLFVGVAWDGEITVYEATLLLFAYGIYLSYIFFHHHGVSSHTEKLEAREKFGLKNSLFFIFGLSGVIFGSKYLIQSVVELADILSITTGVIAVSAIAVGTSLPELFVSVKAALQKKSELALGNIFGSNVFNILAVAGVPGLFIVLPVDMETYTLGLPALIAATLVFIFSGISRRIYAWEGGMFLLLYVFFLGKLFQVL